MRTFAIAAFVAVSMVSGCAKSGQRKRKINYPKVCKSTCAVIRPVCGAALAACAAHESSVMTNDNTDGSN